LITARKHSSIIGTRIPKNLPIAYRELFVLLDLRQKNPKYITSAIFSLTQGKSGESFTLAYFLELMDKIKVKEIERVGKEQAFTIKRFKGGTQYI
jgi:hypothetical protein